MGAGRGRLERQRALERRRGFGQLALLGEGRAQVVLRAGRVGRAGRRLAEVRGGFVGAVLREQGVGQVEVQVGIVAADPEPFAVDANRVVHAPLRPRVTPRLLRAGT